MPTATDTVDAADILILTILPEEYKGVVAELEKISRGSLASGTNLHGWLRYEVPSARGNYAVVVGTSGRAGNDFMQAAVVDGLGRFQPAAVLVVGVAGGLPKDPDPMSPGDVVIADAIWSIDRGKIGDHGLHARPLNQLAGWGVTANMQSLEARLPNWHAGLLNSDAQPPRVIVGGIAASNYLLTVETHEIARAIRDKSGNTVRAVEMESWGATIASNSYSANTQKHVLLGMIRGLSDIVRPAPGTPDVPAQTNAATANSEERDKWKQKAADHAARLAIALIKYTWPYEARKSTAPMKQPLSMPQHRWNPDSSAPAALLRADLAAPVPFHGRGGELDDIDKWCTEKRQLAARLYTGAGGMGKTRLMLEACRRLHNKGWGTGFLNADFGATTEAERGTALDSLQQVFVVIDYAETRQDDVVALIERQAAMATKTRIVLLARTAGDWWDRLQAASSNVGDILSGPGTARIRIQPAAASVEDRKASYQLATTHFRSMLGREAEIADAADLSSNLFERILLLHIKALADVAGDATPGEDEQGLLNYLLLRERRFWAKLATARGLGKELEPGIALAMTVATLKGGLKRLDDAVTAMRALPFFRGQPEARLHAIAKLLSDAYPGSDERAIDPLLPDILGEHLVQHEWLDDENGAEIKRLVFGDQG